MTVVWEPVIAFGVALVGGLALTPVTMRVALRYGVVDNPGPAKIHSAPTPRVAGVAIYLATCLGVAAVAALSKAWHPYWTPVLVGGTVVFVTGMFEDGVGLSARLRLVLQVAAALCLVAFGVRAPLVENGILNALVLILWTVGLTNAFNFMDGMDGLLGGMSCVLGVGLGALALVGGQSMIGAALLAVAGACLGFLFYNFHPARTFMGDSGSTFLGFTLSALALSGKYADSDIAMAAMVLVLFGLFVLDMTMTTVLRVKNRLVRSFREWLAYVGKDHLANRLLLMGLSQRTACAVAYSLSALLVGIALLMQQLGSAWSVALLVILMVTAAAAIATLDKLQPDAK